MKIPIATLIAFTLILLPAALGQVAPVAAAPDTTCYLVADSGGGNGGNDLLTRVDAGSSSEVKIGNGLGTDRVESNAFWPGSNVLYGANASRLGTIDLGSGIFAARADDFGTGSGGAGLQTFDDVDGLAFDPFTGALYGVHRRAGSPNQEDLLLMVDPATGRRIADAFGPGVDYLVIYSQAVVNLVDIDAMAISSYDGQMVAIANSSGGGDRLVRIDKTTGLVDDVGLLGVTDMEGIGFDSLGTLYGVRGTAPYNLYRIDLTTGAATVDTALAPHGSDYEAVDCLTRKNAISDTVYQDADDGDGPGFKVGAGDTGTAGATVRLYRDVNGNGIRDAGDIWLAEQTTAADGGFSFTIAATGAFVLDVDMGTLPPEANRLTDDNLEAADFGMGFDQVDADNDFGWDAAEARLRINKQSSVAGVVSPGDVITYTIRVTNDGLSAQHQIVVTDSLPAGTQVVSGSAWMTTPLTTTGTLGDAFDATTYANSDGSLDWTAYPWSETADDGSATSGKLRIGGGLLSLEGVNGAEKRLTRQAPMADAVAATVSFDWFVIGNLESYQDFIVFEVAHDAGGPWQALLTLQGEVSLADGGDAGSAVADIPASLLGPETRLRFRVIGFEPASEVFSVDNLSVDVTRRPVQSSPAEAPPTLVAGGFLWPGEALTVTFQALVDDPLDAAIVAIDNAAQASSREQAAPVVDGTSDPVAARLGDRVWADANGDGLQDGGETGVAGIGVRLQLSDGSVLTTTTDVNGAYRFEALAAGSYTVTLEAGTFPAGYLPTTAINLKYELAAGDVEQAADFGLARMDLGDLPDDSLGQSYHFPTKLADGGPYHAVTGLYLGNGVDWEVDGQPHILTLADSDDGVLPMGVWNAGQGSILVTASGSGYLNAWLDVNETGQFEAGEQVFTNTLVVAGVQALAFDLPFGWTVANGRYFARIRLSAAPLAVGAFGGYGGAGEVEDYLFGPEPTAVRLSRAVVAAPVAAPVAGGPGVAALAALLLALGSGWAWRRLGQGQCRGISPAVVSTRVSKPE